MTNTVYIHVKIVCHTIKVINSDLFIIRKDKLNEKYLEKTPY